MKINNLIKPLMLTAPLLLVACNGDEPILDPDEESDGVRSSISCVEKGSISRSTPGLDMPFVEYGRDEESRISDALIVIYTRPINDSPNPGTVAAVVKLNSKDLGEGERQWGSTPADNSYYDSDGIKRTTPSDVTFINARRHDIKDSGDLNKAVLNELTPGTTYYAMAFANFGDELDSQITVGMSETSLRDLVYTGPLLTDNSGYYYNANETALNLSNITTAWGSPTISDSGATLTYYNPSSTDPSYPACQWDLGSEGTRAYSIITVNLAQAPGCTWHVGLGYTDETSDGGGWTSGTTASAVVDPSRKLRYIYIQPIVEAGQTVTLKPASATAADPGYGVHREYSHFAMAAVNEVKFTAPQIDASNRPFDLGDFYVQRLAARIDICFGVQATTYNDFESEGASESWMIHYVHMKWQSFDKYYNSAWDGLFKYDMDVPAESNTGYPPGGLYRFPIYDENEYQSNLAAATAAGNELAADEGETDHRLPNDTWFWLENIEILNAVNKGEYLLQHSTGIPNYMGHEGAWIDGYPQYFVPSPASGREIANRDLCPEPNNSPTKSMSDLPDEKRIKVRPVPYIQSMLTGTDDAKYTIQQYHAAYDASTSPYYDFERKFHVSSILGYVGENTYSSYSDANSYTTIRLTGKTNMAAAFTGSASEYQTLTATMRLRHSYGSPNVAQPLCYGVVRNTIYKVFLRFYGEGENLTVRYWYYSGDNNQQYNMSDVPYEATFSKYIVESNGQQGAD